MTMSLFKLLIMEFDENKIFELVTRHIYLD